jgi:hypothetical protein
MGSCGRRCQRFTFRGRAPLPRLRCNLGEAVWGKVNREIVCFCDENNLGTACNAEVVWASCAVAPGDADDWCEGALLHEARGLNVFQDVGVSRIRRPAVGDGALEEGSIRVVAVVTADT